VFYGFDLAYQSPEEGSEYRAPAFHEEKKWAKE
jgi:hypothetical protein